MALKDKLKRIKEIRESKSELDWKEYKENWINSTKKIQLTLSENWFKSMEDEGLMSFSYIPSARFEANIGEYSVMTLEISLYNNKFIIFEPVSSQTTTYDGKLDFYMLGNFNEKIVIFRNLIEDKGDEWLIAKSKDLIIPFTKENISEIIEEWL